jgi:hypothetical protein
MNFMKIMKINWDALGVGTSLACAIHCAVLPLLFTTVPLFGINIVHNRAFEWSMIGIALIVGIQALWHGFQRHHHSRMPVLLLLTGFVFLIIKEWTADNLHLLLVIIAVSFIVSAHYINYRLCRKANHCHAGDCDH